MSVYELARQLGEELLKSEKAEALDEARTAFFADEKAQKLLSVGRSRTVFSMISEERPGWLMELLSHKQLPDKIVTDETLVYTALEDLYGSGASGIEKKLPAAAADSVERFDKRTPELQEGTKCPEISFYRDSRPNLFALYGLAG